MSNSQPPTDPNLDRDLWGDEEPLDRSAIDLKRKQDSDLETSNWDDADDYGREYDEIPGYGAATPTPAPAQPEVTPETAVDDRASDAPEPTDAASTPEPRVNFGDPELYEDEEAPFEAAEPNPADKVPAEPEEAPIEEPYSAPIAEPRAESAEPPASGSAESAPEPIATDNTDPEEENDEAPIETLSETPPGTPSEPAAAIAPTATSDASLANALRDDIAQLRAQKAELQDSLQEMVRSSLQDLEARRQELQTEVERLERRQARIQEEMRTTFAGASQDLAVRVQGFKEYLIGSLQDLSVAAERLQLAPKAPPARPPAASQPRRERPAATNSGNSLQDFTAAPRRDRPVESTRPPQDFAVAPPRRDRDRPNGRSAPIGSRPPARDDRGSSRNDTGFAKQGFQDRSDFIRAELDRYRDRPDYYGPPWQLRRTFQPVQAERVSDWFFGQGGRGVVRSMGSRLQNILVASTAISILRAMHDKRLRTLVLANTPERLGEWRRGLQDCLGITRDDFGPDRGITLFEDPMLMAQKAERLIKAGWLPLIVMDESSAQLNLSLLQFPMWLAFAADPTRSSQSSYDRDWLVR